MTAIPEGATWDITIDQGASYSQAYRFREQVTGAVVDLTGYTGTAQARGVDGLVITFAVAIDAVNGIVTVTAPATATAAATTGGQWDLVLTNGSEVRRPLRGRVHLNRAVTAA